MTSALRSRMREPSPAYPLTAFRSTVKLMHWVFFTLTGCHLWISPPQGWGAQTQTSKAAEQQHHQFCCPPCIQRWQLFSQCLGGWGWLWWHQRGGGARQPGELVIGAVGGVQGAHELGQMDDLWHMLQWAGCILQVCREDIQNILFPLAYKDIDWLRYHLLLSRLNYY